MSQSINPNTSTYLMTLGFLGKPFHGWQSQADASGVQDHLEKALGTMTREAVRCHGASRTDSGVHAEEFPCVFRTSYEFEEFQWRRSLAALLPEAISIKSIREVPSDFNPIRDAVAKVYRYRVWSSPVRNPFFAPYVWQVPQNLDISNMQQDSNDFVGTHDFSAFCASDTSAKTFERTIFEVKIRNNNELTDIWICGKGFLKQMARAMVGTLVQRAQGLQNQKVSELLMGKDRKLSGPTAPANGLSLIKVFYDEPPSLELMIQKASEGMCIGL